MDVHSDTMLGIDICFILEIGVEMRGWGERWGIRPFLSLIMIDFMMWRGEAHCIGLYNLQIHPGVHKSATQYSCIICQQG